MTTSTYFMEKKKKIPAFIVADEQLKRETNCK